MNIVRGRILNHQSSPWRTVTSKTWSVKMAHAQFIKIPHLYTRYIYHKCLRITRYIFKVFISLYRLFPELISYCLHFSLHRDIRRRHLFQSILVGTICLLLILTVQRNNKSRQNLVQMISWLCVIWDTIWLEAIFIEILLLTLNVFCWDNTRFSFAPRSLILRCLNLNYLKLLLN